MSGIAINVENLFKVYKLYDRHVDRLKETLHPFKKKYHRDFYALQDVSFTVRKGEAVGIIGKNGSGKSTLLKIIAGVLSPTRGQVTVNGKVSVLLELGTGFNPELTGTENIYFNGVLMGYTREEIEAKLDDILSFADIGSFVRQPMKTYSSGMYVRLAFAVQACVNPDVLIVDEALAVGDIFFQQKCHARIKKLLETGTSVLLVSHGMGDIQKYCRWAVLLHQGRPVYIGASAEAVKKYFMIHKIPPTAQTSSNKPLYHDESPLAISRESDMPASHRKRSSFWPSENAFLDFSMAASIGDDWARCTAVALCDETGAAGQTFGQGQRACFYYEFEALQELMVPCGSVIITNSRNIIVHGKGSLQYWLKSFSRVPEGQRLRFRQSVVLNLQEGEYTFDVALTMMSPKDYALLALMSRDEILDRLFLLNRISQAGAFAITHITGEGPAVKHTGICDLPGHCEIEAY
jgi:lipopolysaccharide transport system ATP-binding protein